MENLVSYDSGVPALQLGEALDMALLFLFAMLRIGGFIIAAPVFGARFIPLQVRIVTSVILTIPVMSFAELPDPEILLTSRGVGLILGELAIGISAGLLLMIFFSAAVMAGDRIASTAGLGFAAQIDPASGTQAPVVGQLFSLALMVFFVASDSHLVALRIMLDSYEFIPPGTLFDTGILIQSGIAAAGEMFGFAVRLMMPVVSVLLMVNMAIGVITRSAPQLNIFSFGFPLTMTVTIVLLYLGAPILGVAMDKLIEASIDALMQMMTEAANG
ncbi:Flagellar biosynthetic protein FliR [Thalassovita gelatinovora]|uniref:Flagellar biosynthetic protein FliR n=1 Tax=Thalassovita gelatinovora TaxID=53501 RepID=A0A0P1G549_THAGE|nr:flagellar biosynthetic protein FliR [Thalassovita gelatinovora]CUH68479.1 Flagellar biosynthetic protein FliR [Thalassovita gelatinovora]SEQ53125.1 flagellar biosynthetic protein FliR [Thalassovita gelatinovora]